MFFLHDPYLAVCTLHQLAALNFNNHKCVTVLNRIKTLLIALIKPKIGRIASNAKE